MRSPSPTPRLCGWKMAKSWTLLRRGITHTPASYWLDLYEGILIPVLFLQVHCDSREVRPPSDDPNGAHVRRWRVFSCSWIQCFQGPAHCGGSWCPHLRTCREGAHSKDSFLSFFFFLTGYSKPHLFFFFFLPQRSWRNTEPPLSLRWMRMTLRADGWGTALRLSSRWRRGSTTSPSGSFTASPSLRPTGATLANIRSSLARTEAPCTSESTVSPTSL